MFGECPSRNLEELLRARGNARQASVPFVSQDGRRRVKKNWNVILWETNCFYVFRCQYEHRCRQCVTRPEVEVVDKVDEECQRARCQTTLEKVFQLFSFNFRWENKVVVFLRFPSASGSRSASRRWRRFAAPLASSAPPSAGRASSTGARMSSRSVFEFWDLKVLASVKRGLAKKSWSADFFFYSQPS